MPKGDWAKAQDSQALDDSLTLRVQDSATVLSGD